MTKADSDSDPRVVRTRRDVLAAAHRVLVEEGWERVTLARVAERSGYARTTLYRHWPQRFDLLRDLIGVQSRLLHTTPMGNTRADLIAELEAFQAAVTRSGLGRVMIAIGQHARDDAELADLTTALRVDGTRVLADIVVAAIRRNELQSGLDIDAAMALLIGPVVYRYLFENDSGVDATFVSSVVESFLIGAANRR